MKLKNFPLTIDFVVMIFVACMILIPETPLSGVALLDTWTDLAL